MNSRMDRGGGGGGGRRKVFLSAHHCPEVDLLPYHDSETRIPPSCSLVPAEKSPEFTCTAQSEANYLDFSSTCRSEEEEEGSISDWSEEDLSLHFSPSVILPSDDESDPECAFKCVDVTVETKVAGQEGEGLKMVPKRQIHLKKKKDTENINDQEKLQVILKDGPAEGGGANNEASANELFCPIVHHRPDPLLRQHSMPASFCTRLTNSSDVDSYRVYRGLVAGACQGFQVGGSSEAPRRLQKSFSLDETKTKMASCIIKSVLFKKMQVEQSNTKTSHLKKKPEILPALPPPADQQTVREGGGAGGGVCKAPVHTVRDVRSLVKNTYNLSFSTAKTPANYKPTSFKVIGQEDSPPPTYQQAVGVKGQKTNSSRGHVAKVAASLSQSHDRKHSDTLSRPMTQERRDSKLITSRRKVDDVTWPAMLPDPPTIPPVSQSERTRGASHLAGASLPTPPTNTAGGPSLRSLPRNGAPSWVCPVSLPPPPPSSSSTPVSTPLPALHPHLGKVSYIHSPMNYIQIQLQPPPPAPTLHLLRQSEENQNRSTGNTSDQRDCFTKPRPPQQTSTTGDQEGHGDTVMEQQPFLCSVQGFLPAQVSSNFLVDFTGSAVPSGALLSGPTPCNVMVEPKSGQCYYVDTPPQPQRKMLLDPETGQFIQVFLPGAGPTPNTTVYPVCCANPAPTVMNPAPTMLQMSSANPSIVSVMRFQPTIAFTSLYAPPCLPLTLHIPSGNFTHTAP
ncbi:uncharacterized protein prob1 [Seriola aureovittata]|uniref:uncharacterized protein prob1 n=1 Tax=Seriola aureovittata TaxID=2871759 RepID=UPI0024BE32AA|nr:uncharacterized protein prob1 [Seriola aureovittata]XP_056254063.1 uncharacterized protein prob1 [Seriola aureovittata]